MLFRKHHFFMLSILLVVPGKIIPGVIDSCNRYLFVLTGGALSSVGQGIISHHRERTEDCYPKEEKEETLVRILGKEVIKYGFKTVLNPENILLGLCISPETYALGVLTDSTIIALRPVLKELIKLIFRGGRTYDGSSLGDVIAEGTNQVLSRVKVKSPISGAIYGLQGMMKFLFINGVTA
jgi:hypothetical protein